LVGSLAVRAEVDDEDSVLQGVKVTSTIDSSTEKSLKTSQQVYDEDEFVGFEQVRPKEVKKEPTTPASPLETEIPLPPPRTNYYLEIVYISFILVYIVNYWIGKRKNEQIATAWASAVSKAFKSNFSKVGEGKNIGIVKESQNLYKLKATGRINCIGVQATLDLRKRHDLFSLIVELFYKNEDTVTLDILMNDDAMDSYVFAVVKKKDEKKFRKSVPDVPLFAPGSASAPPGFPSSFVVCSECEELTSDFLNSEAQVILTKYEGLFKRLHFSDQAVLSPSYKKTLQFVFRLPDKESDMEGIHILTRMAFYYIDLVAKTTLSKQAKQKATNNRTKALAQASKQTHEQRQEAAQQRKLAKLQKEKAALEKLSPEEQRKAEEKIQKREMKKRMPKFKVSFG
jgi:hypothetical protein